MRTTKVCGLCLSIMLGSVSWVSAGVDYHFKPGIEGQVLGVAQFLEVAPETGPKSFKVLVSGSAIGTEPSTDPSTARAYLDKWGLGVLNPDAGKDLGVQGQVQLDGQHGGEYLRFEFKIPVRPSYLIFACVGMADDFELLADGVALDLDALFPGTGTIKEISYAQGNWPGRIDFANAGFELPQASRWEVFFSGLSIGDGIQVENLGLEVPEPATLVLWSVGLVALAFSGLRRWRRRAG